MEKLREEAQADSWFHSYLLIGNRERADEAINFIIGATKCLLEDIVRLEPASESGKAGEIKNDEVKSFLHTVNLSPAGSMRLGVIYQAHRLNLSSANTLLKTLEEPPKSTIIILVSENQNIISTIKSRCRVYRLSEESRDKDHTFSYSDLLTENLAKSFKQIEEIVKNGETDTLLDELELLFEEKLLKQKSEGAASLLGNIFETKRRIRGNANPRLAIENLIIEARKL